MQRTLAILLALTVTLAIPMVGADSHDDAPDDNATWGLCQAYYASTIGNETSNGTAHDAPAFDGINATTCDDATAPWNGTAGDGYVPPEADDPGKQAPQDPDDHPGQDDNPGDGYGP